jgi:hypothetical protein
MPRDPVRQRSIVDKQVYVFLSELQETLTRLARNINISILKATQIFLSRFDFHSHIPPLIKHRSHLNDSDPKLILKVSDVYGIAKCRDNHPRKPSCIAHPTITPPNPSPFLEQLWNFRSTKNSISTYLLPSQRTLDHIVKNISFLYPPETQSSCLMSPDHPLALIHQTQPFTTKIPSTLFTQHNHPMSTKPASAKDRSIVLFKNATLYIPISALGRSLYHPPQPPIALKPTKTSFLSCYRTHTQSYYPCFLRTWPNSIPSPPCTKHTQTQLYLLSPRISSLGGVKKRGKGT